MTNQEAIGVLKLINVKTDHILINDDARSEAIEMAIKALEQSESCNDDKDCSNCMYSGRPTYKSPCSECRDNSQWEMKPISRSNENGTECEDTISRQEAIEAVEHITSSMSVCVNTDECHGMKRMQRRAVIELTNLPSAQPEITDEQAIKHLQSSGWMQNHDKQMYEMGLKEQLADDSGSYDTLLPSAQPENIRCYECKHGTHSGCGNVYICNVSTELVMEHTGDFYCGYAERREE